MSLKNATFGASNTKTTGLKASQNYIAGQLPVGLTPVKLTAQGFKIELGCRIVQVAGAGTVAIVHAEKFAGANAVVADGFPVSKVLDHPTPIHQKRTDEIILVGSADGQTVAFIIE